MEPASSTRVRCKGISVLKYELYYQLKPFIPKALQIYLRRKWVLRKLTSCKGIWPIDERSAASPIGWTGWPNGSRFALVVTHDVESKKGVERCLPLSELDKELGIRSCFNFVAEDYRIPSSLFDFLRKNQFEIGLHGLSHHGNLFGSGRHFKKKIGRINDYLKQWNCAGFRTPSMYHNLDWIGELDLAYDTSTFDTDPFEPQPDGVHTIFPFYVRGQNGREGYIELPYTLPQDFTLFILMKEGSIDIWKKKLDWIAKRGGMALLLVHPDYMNFGGNSHGSYEYPAEHYTAFLRYVQDYYKAQCWHALPGEMARFWRKTCLEPHLPEPAVGSAWSSLKSVRRPLRVAMLSYSFYDMDARVSRYAQTLARRGDHVDVISIGRQSQADFERMEGVNVYRVQKRERNEQGKLDFASRLLRFLINSARVLNALHRKNPYDVIHVHSVPDFEVFAAWLPKLRGAKVILDIHDIVPEFYASKFGGGQDSLWYKMLIMIERISGAFSDHVIISNHLWGNTLCRSVNPEKCSVIMNYPDETIFHPRPRSSRNGKFVMVYPGTLNWHQGLDVAVKAVQRIRTRAPQVEFHIYGSGDSQGTISDLVGSLSLEESVFLHDMLPKEQIAEVMAKADVGVVPKRNDAFGGEAFSTKSLEFMSLGVPLVLSETKIDRYYFNDSVVRFFESENVDALASAVLDLIDHPNLRKTLSENALKFVEELSWSQKKSEYLDLVDRLADGVQ